MERTFDRQDTALFWCENGSARPLSILVALALALARGVALEDQPDARASAAACTVMNKKEPRNKKSQAPTRSSKETVDRLEQKKRGNVGKANRERVERQERDVRSR
jgi:hypothetical protein